MRGPSSSPSSPAGRPRPAWGDEPRPDERGGSADPGWTADPGWSAAPSPGGDDAGEASRAAETGSDERAAGRQWRSAGGPSAAWEAAGEGGAEREAAGEGGAERESAGEGGAERASDGAEPEPGASDAAFERGEPVPGDEVDRDSAAVAAVAAERDEYLDALRRLQADFENYRKRMAKQQGDQLQRAAESLVTKLLPVLDTVDLALAHAAGSSGAPGTSAGAPSDPEGAPAVAGPDSVGAGRPSGGEAAALAQISGALSDVLGREGLERIDPKGGPFDPTEHDAVMHDPDGEAGDGPEVTEVLRAGYRWKGRVLRPAMVKVRG